MVSNSVTEEANSGTFVSAIFLLGEEKKAIKGFTYNSVWKERSTNIL
jgi:hypothetical protein